MIPPSSLYASDIDEAALRFCASEFGVRTFASTRDLGKIRFPAEFDLIWVGSLFTHLDRADYLLLLRATSAAFAAGGTLAFSANGTKSLDFLDRYGIRPPQRVRVQEILARDGGIFFSPYPGDDESGISISLPQFVLGQAEEQSRGALRLVELRKAGWDSHQDLYSFRKE